MLRWLRTLQKAVCDLTRRGFARSIMNVQYLLVGEASHLGDEENKRYLRYLPEKIEGRGEV